VVCSGRNAIEGAHITLPEYVGGTTTWLSILYVSENPLNFDMLLGRHIEHLDGRKSSVTTCHNNEDEALGSAIASGYVMKSGVHYAEFQLLVDCKEPIIYVGLVRPMPNLDLGLFAEKGCADFFINNNHFLAQKTDEWGGNVHVCDYCARDGLVGWSDWNGREIIGHQWMSGELETNDTVGMLLNLDEGSLAVYKNNDRIGVMKRGLSGIYCWYTTLTENTAVTIKKPNNVPNICHRIPFGDRDYAWA